MRIAGYQNSFESTLFRPHFLPSSLRSDAHLIFCIIDNILIVILTCTLIHNLDAYMISYVRIMWVPAAIDIGLS